MFYILFFLASAPVCFSAENPDASESSRFYAGLGLLNENLGKASNAPSGKEGTFSRAFLNLNVGYKTPFFWIFNWHPALYLTPFGKVSEDSSTKVYYFLFEPGFSMDAGPVDVRFGP